MANTIDAGLIAATISTKGKTVLANRLAALSLFSSDFSDQVKKPKDTIQVPLATATSATVLNPTAFNSVAGTTLAKATVTLDHVYQPFGLEYADIQNAIKLENLIQVNMDALADKIWALATAPITVVNFGAAVVTAADSAITPTSGDLAKLWAGVSKSRRRGLVTNAGIYANLIPTNALGLPLGTSGSYGFEAGVFYASSFNGVAKLAAFACDQSAIAVASAAPALDHVKGLMLESNSMTIDELGLTVYYNIWVDASSRNIIASFEVMFGAAKGITTGTMALALNP
jgi:hypothetical protein